MLKGNIINLRLVNEKDAQFILSLRTNKELSKFISSTNTNIEEQREWIKSYKFRERENKEFYYIVEDKRGTPYGTVRIYNINYEIKETTWGSFILNKARPEGTSAEVIRLSLDFILNELKLNKVHLEVKKGNSKAIHIYEKNNFTRTGEDSENYYYLKRLG